MRPDLHRPDLLAQAQEGRARQDGAGEDEGKVRNQRSQDPLNFPIMLNNKIASLQGIVESADAQPTDQTYDMFKLLSSRLDEQMNKLDTAVQKDLPQVNQMLQRQKLMPIKPVPLKPEEKPKPKSDR